VTLKATDYHTIFFDVGGTLLRTHPSIGSIYAEVAARHGIEVSPKEIESRMRKNFFEMREGERDKRPETADHTLSLESARRFWYGLVRTGLGPAADVPQYDVFFDDVFEEFAKAERYRFFSEAESVLTALERMGCRLGLISNWDVRLRRVLREMDAEKRFDVIVISGEVGAEKPDPAIFHAAREMAGAGPDDRLLQIGDSRRDDVEGARAAGFDARLVNRMAGETLATVLNDLLD
jgi:putative hydrolase of the HAD superfamily